MEGSSSILKNAAVYHYRGDCFVFDQRVAVGPDLKPTGVLLASASKRRLHLKTLPRQSMRSCILSQSAIAIPTFGLQEAISARQATLQAVAASQPGCQPYDSRRVVHVARRFCSIAHDRFPLCLSPNIPREEWLNEIETGRLRLRGERVSADRLFREGSVSINVSIGGK